MTNDSNERGQHHQQLLPMIVTLEVDKCVFVVDVLDNNDDGDGKDDGDIIDDSILFPPFLFSISHTPVVQQKEEDEGNDHQQQ